MAKVVRLPAEIRYQQLTEFFQQKKTIPEIQAELCISRVSILRYYRWYQAKNPHVQQYDIELKKETDPIPMTADNEKKNIRKITPELREKAIAMFEKGETGAQVWRALGCSRSLAYNMYYGWQKNKQEKLQKVTGYKQTYAVSYMKLFNAYYYHKVELHNHIADIPDINKWIDIYNQYVDRLK